MKLSYSVMASRKRAEMAEELAAELGCPIAWDPKGQRRPEESVWPTRRLALWKHDPRADHHIVIQDDGVLARDFQVKAKAIIAEKPGHVHCLYFRNRARRSPDFIARAQAAEAAGESGFQWHKLHQGLAVSVPVEIIPSLVVWGDKDTVKGDDIRISRFLQVEGIPVWYAIPSLVQHRPDVRGRNGPNSMRPAYRFDR